MSSPKVDYDEQDDYYDGETLPTEDSYWSWGLCHPVYTRWPERLA